MNLSIALLRKSIPFSVRFLHRANVFIALALMCVSTSLTAKQIQDSDGDGLSDQYEIQIGTEAYLADTDGDGINDGIEVGPNLQNPLNSDNDKRIDALDYDDDNDGLPTILEYQIGKYADIDNDGLKNHLDNDSDNDGVLDGVEAGGLNLDENFDGVDDAFDVEYIGGVDKNGDGISDNIKLPDQNKDGIPDYLDANFSTGVKVVSKIKLPSTNVISQETKPKINKSESKQVVVNRYTDTDNDGLLDSQEIILGTNPLKRDTDGDSVSDAIEIGMDINAPQDSDHDNIIDALDPDDDNDGVLTKLEDINKDGSPINDDTDDDGVPNYLDGNDDGDEKLTIIEGGINDTDNDGILDYLDKYDGKKSTTTLAKNINKPLPKEPEIIVLYDGDSKAIGTEFIDDKLSDNITDTANKLLNDVVDINNEKIIEKPDSKVSKETKMTELKKTGAATWSWTFF